MSYTKEVLASLTLPARQSFPDARRSEGKEEKFLVRSGKTETESEEESLLALFHVAGVGEFLISAPTCWSFTPDLSAPEVDDDKRWRQ